MYISSRVLPKQRKNKPESQTGSWGKTTSLLVFGELVSSRVLTQNLKIGAKHFSASVFLLRWCFGELRVERAHCPLPYFTSKCSRQHVSPSPTLLVPSFPPSLPLYFLPHSFTHYLLTHSVNQLLFYSLPHSFTLFITLLLTHSINQSFFYSHPSLFYFLLPSLFYSLTHSSFYSLPLSFIPSLFYSLSPALTIYPHSLTHLFIHYMTKNI